MTSKVFEFQVRLNSKRAAQQAWQDQVERTAERHVAIEEVILTLSVRGHTKQEIATAFLFFAADLERK